MGFTEPTRSPGPLVSSYLTVSPLPPVNAAGGQAARRAQVGPLAPAQEMSAPSRRGGPRGGAPRPRDRVRGAPRAPPPRGVGDARTAPPPRHDRVEIGQAVAETRRRHRE